MDVTDLGPVQQTFPPAVVNYLCAAYVVTTHIETGKVIPEETGYREFDGVFYKPCSCTADKALVFRIDGYSGEVPKGPFICYPKVEEFSVFKKPCSPCDETGNPIYPGIGAKRETVDLGVKLLGDLKITIGYDSRHVMPIAQVVKRTMHRTGEVTTTTGVPSSTTSFQASLGFTRTLGSPAWGMSLNRRLRNVENGSIVYAMRGDGSIINFARQADLSYPSPAGINIKLIDDQNGYFSVLDTQTGDHEKYDPEGRLQEIYDKNGLLYSFRYSDANTPESIAPAPNLLISVSYRYRDVYFKYSTGTSGGAARLSEVIDASGTSTLIGYDANGNLNKIQWPDGSIRTFLYQNPSFNWALTGVVDENNSQYSKFEYNSNGKAISTEHANLVQKYSVNYSNQPAVTLTEVTDHQAQKFFSTYSVAAPTGMQLTTPQGGVRTVNYTTILGQNYASSQTQSAGSGHASSTRTTTYDSNANVTSTDDFTGKRTCFVNDLARNLQTTRVEGLSTGASCGSVTPANATLPAGVRKISTQWHPDWRLPVRIAEPGKITTYVYNGRPDPTAGNAVASCAEAGTNLLPNGSAPAMLCKRVEQATTDVDGSKAFAAASQAGVTARTWKWTYNQYAQVLTEDGPRTDVADITTYTYHDDATADFNRGDLKTVTNAAGKITQYTKYNKHGQLLESIDPNEVVSSFTYDLRQRMLSSTVGGQTTSYTYDPVGQLKRITRPDTSWVGYDYDAAHRLIATYDNLGNRVDYTLDNAGNKTAENVKDPAGVLKRQLARSIDALGRVQQTTGRE